MVERELLLFEKRIRDLTEVLGSTVWCLMARSLSAAPTSVTKFVPNRTTRLRIGSNSSHFTNYPTSCRGGACSARPQHDLVAFVWHDHVRGQHRCTRSEDHPSGTLLSRTRPPRTTDMPTLDTEVLISGAETTGLTLACDLARRKIPSRVIDKSSTYFIDSKEKASNPAAWKSTTTSASSMTCSVPGNSISRFAATTANKSSAKWTCTRSQPDAKHSLRQPAPHAPMADRGAPAQSPSEARRPSPTLLRTHLAHPK